MLWPKTYTPTEGYTEIVTPGERGITRLHFGILHLPPEGTFFGNSEDTAVALIALGGQCTLLVGHNGNKAYGGLGERRDVFHGEACVAYIPHRTTYEVLAGAAGIEIAVCKVPSAADSPAVILEAGETADENETPLRIWESTTSGKADVNTWNLPMRLTAEEAICLQRFRHKGGVATFDLAHPIEMGQVELYHNEVLAIPEQVNIVGLTSVGSGYQLWVQPQSVENPQPKV